MSIDLTDSFSIRMDSNILPAIVRGTAQATGATATTTTSAPSGQRIPHSAVAAPLFTFASSF